LLGFLVALVVLAHGECERDGVLSGTGGPKQQQPNKENPKKTRGGRSAGRSMTVRWAPQKCPVYLNEIKSLK